MLAFLLISHFVQNNHLVDRLTDVIAENDGTLPSFHQSTDEEQPPEDWQQAPQENDKIFNAETAFTTRFFVVTLSDTDTPESTDLSHISSITEETAKAYAEKAVNRGRERGWISVYRYKIFETSQGDKAIVFVNGSLTQAMSNSNMISTILIFLVTSGVILTLIILFSRWAVKPIAESYEKQKQFIIDANHELKTPLTLILTDLDIAESEVVQNEWLDDIRTEGQRMSTLVNQLVVLSRMDEARPQENDTSFCFSDAAADTVSEFQTMAKQRHITLTTEMTESLHFLGDEAELRRLVAILLDNAVKYCDEKGMISVTLKKLKGKRHILFTVENSFQAVQSLELERLFDRFYRADKARTSGNGYGIGLSIAKSIVEKYGGEIHVHAVKNRAICFTFRL